MLSRQYLAIEFADKNFARVARKLDLQILTTLSVGGRVGTLCVRASGATEILFLDIKIESLPKIQVGFNHPTL